MGKFKGMILASALFVCSLGFAEGGSNKETSESDMPCASRLLADSVDRSPVRRPPRRSGGAFIEPSDRERGYGGSAWDESYDEPIAIDPYGGL